MNLVRGLGFLSVPGLLLYRDAHGALHSGAVLGQVENKADVTLCSVLVSGFRVQVQQSFDLH